MVEPKQLTDGALIRLWEQVEDPENLSDDEQAVIDEMERRGTDF